MPPTALTGSRRTSRFFSDNPYRSFSFLFNATCGLALVALDIWMIIRGWRSASEEVITFMAFWIGLVAIVGPFITYWRTYSELHVRCQAVQESEFSDAVGGLVLVAAKALDTQMLQYYAVLFTMILCLAKVFGHR
jgi:hypothetical protein